MLVFFHLVSGKLWLNQMLTQTQKERSSSQQASVSGEKEQKMSFFIEL